MRNKFVPPAFTPVEWQQLADYLQCMQVELLSVARMAGVNCADLMHMHAGLAADYRARIEARMRT